MLTADPSEVPLLPARLAATDAFPFVQPKDVGKILRSMGLTTYTIDPAHPELLKQLEDVYLSGLGKW